MTSLYLWCTLITWLLKIQLSTAYIPALPTNDTSSLAQSDDLLHLAYYNGPFSVFSADVARQLLAEGFGDDGNYTNTTTIIPWTRYSKGVLLHFDEGLRSQPPAAVPWLALISCDTNGTSFSDVDDIFTICRDLGAQAALLYSLTSQGCEINTEYLDSFEKVLDVYATTSLQNARIIENQFGNVNSSAWQYNSEALNASATIIDALLANNALSVVGNIPINTTTTEDVDESETTASSTSNDESTATSTESITATVDQSTASATLRRVRRQAASESGLSTRPPSTRSSASRTRSVPSPTVAINYLGAVIAARNLTVGGLNSSAAPSPTQTGRNNDGPSTGLAMIILYSITGVVTFLFFAVILCGAIRAIRYPERYGPRAGFGYGNRATGSGGNGGAQNRAQGLARAVLDTFPVVRFGAGSSNEGHGQGDEEVGAKDDESQKDSGKEFRTSEIELTQLAPVLSAIPRTVPRSVESEEGGKELEGVDSTGVNGGGRSRSIHSHDSSSSVRRPTTDHNDSSLGLLTVIGPSSSPFTTLSPPILDLAPSAGLSPSLITASPLPSTTATDEEQPSCPICVCDFAPGDSIRILPCDGRHQFHVDCIDPWLLGVSRLCPLCRLDLGENRGAGEGGVAGQAVPETIVTEETEGNREARERERERHEEERVVRHLRGLLNRNTTSSSLANGGGGGTRRIRSNSQNPLDALDTPLNQSVAVDLNDPGTRDTVGLRSRFAKYVAIRRRRRDTSSNTMAAIDPLF